MLFDDVITTHVGHGKGQAFVLLSSSASWATLAMIVLNMVFVTQKPEWQCTDAADHQCVAAQQRTDAAGFCELAREQYVWLNPHSSLVSSFGLVCNDSWKVGFVNAMFFFGFWVGSSMFGWLADKYGRKRCLLLSNAASCATAVLCASSSSYTWYVVSRTALGFCCPGLPVASYVLSTEAVGPQYRGRAGTYSQLLYHIGEWLLPLLAFWLQDWRLLNLATAAVCVVTAALLLPCPESPRWLLVQGRKQEAAETLSWLASLNGRQLPQDLELTHTTAGVPGGSSPERGASNAVGKATAGAGYSGSRTACECTAGAVALRSSSSSSSRSVDGVGSTPFQISQGSNQSSEAAGLPSMLLLAAPARSFCLDSDDTLDDGGQQAGDCTALLVASEHDTLKSAVRDQHSTEQRVQNKQLQQEVQHRDDSLGLLFRHALLARYFALTSLQCLVMASAFYTINLATDSLQGSLYTNFFLTSAGEVPTVLIAAAAVDVCGRRATVGTGLIITGLACCACSLLSPGWANIALASLGKAACSGTWTVVFVYAAEMFPTAIRSAALAGTNQASRLGGAIAPGIIYVSEHLSLSEAAPFAVVGVMALLAAASLGWLPETLGKPQPDSIADFDRLYGNIGSDCQEPQASLWSRLGRKNKGAGSTGGINCSSIRSAFGRQQSKLRRLLSQMSRSSRSGSSWTIQASSLGANSSGDGWQAVQADDQQSFELHEGRYSAASTDQDNLGTGTV